MRNLIKKILKESEEGLGWAIDLINNTPDLPARTKNTTYEIRIVNPSINYLENIVKLLQSLGWRSALPWQESDYDTMMRYYRDYGTVYLYLDTTDPEEITYGYNKPNPTHGKEYREIKIGNSLKESEDDFSWVNLPEVPEMYSYMDKVRYALLNTEFELKYDGNGSWLIWLNSPNEELYGGVMVSERTPYFSPGIILSSVKNTVDNHKNEWYHPFYEKLYNILKQIP